MKYVKCLNYNEVAVNQIEEVGGAMAFVIAGQTVMHLASDGRLLLYSLDKRLATVAGLQLDKEGFVQVVRI